MVRHLVGELAVDYALEHALVLVEDVLRALPLAPVVVHHAELTVVHHVEVVVALVALDVQIHALVVAALVEGVVHPDVQHVMVVMVVPDAGVAVLGVGHVPDAVVAVLDALDALDAPVAEDAVVAVVDATAVLDVDPVLEDALDVALVVGGLVVGVMGALGVLVDVLMGVVEVVQVDV